MSHEANEQLIVFDSDHQQEATLQDYIFYAATTREEESGYVERTVNHPHCNTISPEEKRSSRAMRTATWGMAFYIAVTYILGPTSVPKTNKFEMGIYSAGLRAWYRGLKHIWWTFVLVFLGLDSDKYPVRGSGDLVSRLLGPVVCRFFNIGQSVQLILTVSVLTRSTGQSILQISRGPTGSGDGWCFIVCLLTYVLFGLVLGQIRTLQRLGWLAHASTWFTITLMLLCIGSVGYGPNFAASTPLNPISRPIRTFSGIPPDSYSYTGTESGGMLKGINTVVYAYGDSLLFANLLGEMKNPSDFWRVLIMAVALVYAVYVFFGTFIYSYYGQYTYNPIVQGIANYSIQRAANTVAVVSSLIIAVLYTNVGVKIIYVEVLRKLFGFPALRSQRGRWFWAGSVTMYWAIAFLIAAFAPSFSYIIAFLGAWIMLSYAFPALMAIAYWMQKDIITANEQHVSINGTRTHMNYGFQDWKRTLGKRPVFYAANILLLGSAFALFGRSMYSAIEDALYRKESGGSSGLTCKGPI